MHKSPTITIHIDPEKDAKLLWEFLNHPQFPQLRTSNLVMHPHLKESVGKENFEEIVHAYTKSFYVEHAQEIELIYKQSKNLLEQKGSLALQELSRLMDYEWVTGTNYNAYISILTVSTFDDGIFTYSILGELYKRNAVKKSLLSVGIHEISHLIFFELLKPIEQKHRIKLHQDGRYFLKEALTTAMLNTETFRSILETEPDPGNPEIRKLYITMPHDANILFIEYIKGLIIQSKIDKVPFTTLLEKLVLNTHAIEKSLNEKRALWNKHGSAIFKDVALLAAYEASIPFANKGD